MGDHMSMEIVHIERNVERGCWTAVVRSGAELVELDTASGSWQTPPLDTAGHRREALPDVARRLQAAVKHAA
jgi:hypothetical protein